MAELIIQPAEMLAFNAGDQQIYGKIYEHYVDWLTYYVHRQIDDDLQAEDIAVEGLIIIWENRERFDTLQDIHKFLFTTVNNRIIDFVRRRDVRRKNASALAYQLKNQDDDPGLGQLLDKHPHLLADIHAFVTTLPPRERDVFNLIYVSEYTHKEVAKLMDLNKNTITKLKTNALRQLRLFLSSKGFVVLGAMLQFIFTIS